MEEPTPIENTPQASKAPGSSPQENPAAPKSKLLAGALLAVVLVVGLYYVNRYWISPAVRAQNEKRGEPSPSADVFADGHHGQTAQAK